MSRRELEHALREGGEKVSEGRFRIDAARALQRLRDFRFADPSHWVLEVLRAAVASGARQVRVRTDADDVELSFDGRPFPADGMKHLLEQALNVGATPEEQRLRLLALGVAGALGTGAVFVKVASGPVALTVTPAPRVELEEGTARSTTLHLRKAFGWRVAASFVRGAPEAAAIRERARHFPVSLVLNGDDVVAPREKQPLERTAKGDGWMLVAAVPPGPPRPHSTVELDVLGVTVAHRTLVAAGAQVHARIRGDQMRRNASGSDVVDDDGVLRDAVARLHQVSLELLEAQVAALDDDDLVLRRSFVARLHDPGTRDSAKALLREAPLIPGPGGEWWSLAQLDAAVAEGPLYVAKERYTRGAYPRPTVLLTPGAEWEKLLPKAQRANVADIVKRKQRIAENRERLAAMPVEEPRLAERDWVTKGPIAASDVSGEVGFERRRGGGALLRLLHHGRLVQNVEVPWLAPLSLRAVVDYRRPIADALFAEVPSGKLSGLVTDLVVEAAEKALTAALAEPDAAPHARALLHRLVVDGNRRFAELPVALRAAPLFDCVDSGPASLDDLEPEPTWNYVRTAPSQGLLDGSRLLVLDAIGEALLRALGPKRLQPVDTRLAEERLLRQRLASANDEPVVRDVAAAVRIEGTEGAVAFQGRLGVPRQAGSRLELTLIRRGFTLETTELPARYHLGVGAIECAALEPNRRWNAAVRDATFDAVVAAVNAAQRRLAAELVRTDALLAQRDPGAQLYLVAFIKKELTPLDPARLDDVQRAVAAAPLFDGLDGPTSLLALHAAAQETRRLWVLPPGAAKADTLGLLVIREQPGTSEVLAKALGVETEDPSKELARREGRRRLEAWPRVEFELGRDVPLQRGFVARGFRVRAGLAAGIEPVADVRVLISQRSFAQHRFPSPVPLVVLVDSDTLEPSATRTLSREQQAEVAALVAKAAQEVVDAALAADVAQGPDGRRALLCALGRGLDEAPPALENAPLFPCTDGKLRSARSLEAALGKQALQFVTRPMEGALPNELPIVVAADPALSVGVQRFGQRVDVERDLEAQNAALAARRALPRVEALRVPVESPWRRAFDVEGISGEVVVSDARAGQLALYLDMKPLCVLERALPHPLAAAVNSYTLTPEPGFRGVVRDAELERVIEAVLVAAEALAADAGARHGAGATLADPPRLLVDLALLVAERHAWQWRGQKSGKKKKNKGKSKQREDAPAATPLNPLLEVRLFSTADGGALSFGDLLARQRLHGEVECSFVPGRLLEPDRVVWLARRDEQERVMGLGILLKNVTRAVENAESVRARARVDSLDAPVASRWREKIGGPRLEGEVALGNVPDRTLVVELVRDRVLVERYVNPEHPVGGFARVESSTLVPDEAWREVKRNNAFKETLAAVDAALARLVARRLEDEQGRFQWAYAALGWKAASQGPVGAALANLALFEDLRGAPVTVGAVLAEASRAGRVNVARGRLAAPSGALVVADAVDSRRLFERLGVKVEDVTAELAQAADLARSLTSRRLASLAWTGPALCKRAVKTAVLEGELALVATGDATLKLAREGIVVQPHATWPGVAGALDVNDLSVNADWTQATPTNAQRAAIRAEVEQLFAALGEVAPALDATGRASAACHVLNALSGEGVEAAAHLDRLNGGARVLKELRLFRTVAGELVNLDALAAEALSRGRVPVMSARLISPDLGDALVLETASWDEPWLAALERVLGKGRVWRVTDLAEWRQLRAEADPPEGTPELAGLRLLRRHVRLLRAGALGQLTPDELDDVRLSRAGGRGEALRYDAKRKLVLVDPDHELAGRTLREAKERPERIWVLVAAMFGVVNRALDHVTDAHEAKLLAALAGHLAANPKLLE